MGGLLFVCICCSIWDTLGTPRCHGCSEKKVPRFCIPVVEVSNEFAEPKRYHQLTLRTKSSQRLFSLKRRAASDARGDA